jgi:glycerol-3-phosphate dehydrogenase (NAD(P)+)
MKHKIGIIGAGAWGTALSVAAVKAGNEVFLWSRNIEVVNLINKFHENKIYLNGIKLTSSINATTHLEQILKCDVILIVVPAQQLRNIIMQIKEFNLPKNIPVILCCKGIEQESLKLTSEIANEYIANPVAILSGPNFADEVALGLPTGTSIACEDQDLGMKLVQILGSTVFRPYYIKDIIGAQIGGAVKNVLAIACGICEGKKLGQNAKATLVTRGIAEIGKLSIALGGDKQTLMFLCGIGDILLTCGSIKSRNMSLGFALGKGEKLEEILQQRNYVTEGVTTAKSVFDLAKKLQLDLPICQQVYNILYSNVTVEETIKNLLQRPLTAE